MDRRTFLGTVGAGIVLAAAATAAAVELAPRVARTPVAGTTPLGTLAPVSGGPSLVPSFTPTATPTVIPTPSPTPVVRYPWEPFGKPALVKVRVPHGTIYGLPGAGNRIALTVDDGNSSEVVRKYIEFAKQTGMRLTFFLNGSRPSWTENARALRPLVASGQIQLGNHTWSHPDLRKLSDGAIVDELSRNDAFIRNTYGVHAKPFFRPPYGNHDARVDRVAASIGYSTPVMWYGTLSDAEPIPPATLRKFAKKWLLAQHIVIGHANAPTVTWNFPYLDRLIHERHLTPVTLNDVFAH